MNRDIETCINYCDPDKAFVSSNERRWITKVQKLAQEHPDEMVILRKPEDNNGVIYARFPAKWARISPPKKIHMTDERRDKLAENLRLYRESAINEKEGLNNGYKV